MPDINVNKLSEILNTKADIDLNNTGVFSTNGGVVNLVQSTPSDAKEKEVASADFSLKQGGLELMDVVFAPLGIDESKNKRRYLNGQVLIQSQFPAFTAAVKSRMTTMANAFTTETNWQAEKTNSKLGQCGKFVVDDTAGTIRLPAVVNAQGLVDLALIGTIKSESLPNITGEVIPMGGNLDGYIIRNSDSGDGALFIKSADITGKTGQITSGTYGVGKIALDSSRSSSAYQDNAPVQQEAVQYPYCIVVNTGVEESDRPINNYQVNNVYSYGMSQYYKGTMNNNSWLKSAGQWNDGTVYTGMYNWLLEQMNAGVSGFVASTAAYTDYDFVINTTDRTFRLPLLNGDRVLVKKYVNGTDWYNLYSDGWVEQGGQNSTGAWTKVTLLKPYSDTNYTVVCGNLEPDADNNICAIGTHTKAADSFYLGQYFNGTPYGRPMWMACGYTTIPTQSDFTAVTGLYYYVGDTLQNAQLINVARIEEKLTDMNATSRGYVVETYHNGTEWYRIYSDGWCEQGFYDTTNADHVVTLLTPMADKNYVVSIGQSGDGASAQVGRSTWKEKTATTLKIKSVTPTDWVIAGYKA